MYGFYVVFNCFAMNSTRLLLCISIAVVKKLTQTTKSSEANIASLCVSKPNNTFLICFALFNSVKFFWEWHSKFFIFFQFILVCTFVQQHATNNVPPPPPPVPQLREQSGQSFNPGYSYRSHTSESEEDLQQYQEDLHETRLMKEYFHGILIFLNFFVCIYFRLF